MNLQAVSEELGKEGLSLIKEVCDVALFRLPGSEGETKAQLFLDQKLKSYGAESTEIREFKVYSKFFLHWPRVTAILFFASIAAYVFFPLLALLLAILGALNMGLKLFSFTFLDVLFKANRSTNVIAKIKPKTYASSGKAKRIVIVGGHTDSTYEFPIGKKIGTGLAKIAIPVAITMGFWILISLIKTIIFAIDGKLVIATLADAAFVLTKPDWFFYIILIPLPFFVYVATHMVIDNPVPGANDNLSGVAVAAETLKYFAQPENRLNNIELWAVCFGSEEGGMMGSKALSKEVLTALKDGSFPAESIWVINFDSIAANGPIHIATRESLYRVKSHSPIVFNQLAKSAENAGLRYHLKSLSAGTDSAPFSRLGIPACGMVIFGEGHSPANWHSPEDTVENCDVRGIINSIHLSLQFLKDLDKMLD
jgi:hypothetical protein